MPRGHVRTDPVPSAWAAGYTGERGFPSVQISVPARITIVLLLLCQASLAGERLRRPATAPDPCASITWTYSERIESQGFLGLLTPKASWRNVAQGMHSTPRLAPPLALSRFCETLSRRGAKRVAVHCSADTVSGNECDDTARVRGSGINVRYEPRPGCIDADRPRIDARCVVARLPCGKAPQTYEDFHACSVGNAFGRAEAKASDRHSEIARPDSRVALYREALVSAIDGLLTQERIQSEREELRSSLRLPAGDSLGEQAACAMPRDAVPSPVRGLEARLPSESVSPPL